MPANPESPFTNTSWLTTGKNNAPVIAVHAQPGAKRTAVVGVHGDRLKIALASPPVDGKANATLIKYLSKGLGVSKSSVRLLSGDTSREKRIEVVGLSTDDLLEALKKLLSVADGAGQHALPDGVCMLGNHFARDALFGSLAADGGQPVADGGILGLKTTGRGLADDRSHADEFAAELLRQIDGRINRLVTQIRPVCSYQYLNASLGDLLIESNTFVLKRLVTHQIIVPASSSRLTCIPALS